MYPTCWYSLHKHLLFGCPPLIDVSPLSIIITDIACSSSFYLPSLPSAIYVGGAVTSTLTLSTACIRGYWHISHITYRSALWVFIEMSSFAYHDLELRNGPDFWVQIQGNYRSRIGIFLTVSDCSALFGFVFFCNGGVVGFLNIVEYALTKTCFAAQKYSLLSYDWPLRYLSHSILPHR